MADIKSLIVAGKFFVPVKEFEIQKVKSAFQDYFLQKGFIPENRNNFIFHDRFYSSSYELNIGNKEFNFIDKIMLFFKILDHRSINDKQYYSKLKKLRPEIPFKITLNIIRGSFKSRKGVIIKVRCISVNYFQVCQIDENYFQNKETYDKIDFEGSTFINDLVSAFHGQVIDDPKPLSSNYEKELLKKLRFFGFNKIEKLFEAGLKKLDKGENSISDLIAVIELFLEKIVLDKNLESKGLHKPEKNLKTLHVKNYLSTTTHESIKQILFNTIYRKLKDLDHNKEEINNFDLKLYYNLIEQIIDFMLEFIVKYNLKFENGKQK